MDVPVPAKAMVCRTTVELALVCVRECIHERGDATLNLAAVCPELRLPRRTPQY